MFYRAQDSVRDVWRMLSPLWLPPRWAWGKALKARGTRGGVAGQKWRKPCSRLCAACAKPPSRTIWGNREQCGWSWATLLRVTGSSFKSLPLHLTRLRGSPHWRRVFPRRWSWPFLKSCGAAIWQSVWKRREGESLRGPGRFWKSELWWDYGQVNIRPISSARDGPSGSYGCGWCKFTTSEVVRFFL